jgi:hypothetical protein
MAPSRRRSFQDAALSWANAHPEEARRCLAVPPIIERNPLSHPGPDDEATRKLKLSTLEDYVVKRGWDLGTSEHGLALVSHVLSAPLTLRMITEQFLAQKHARQSWCCIGARAEATLPPRYWGEMMDMHATTELELHFVGPDVRVGGPPADIHRNGSRLSLNWTYRGLFHDLSNISDQSWTHFVLFNPGLGHPQLKEHWLPTLSILKGRPLCLTAHSLIDAEQDSQLLEELGFADTSRIVYRPNPFSSRVLYQDPFDSSHFVSPNKYVAWIGDN